MKKTTNTQRVKALTGGYAAAEALKQIHPDVMAVYPITPQTPIIETYAKMKADGQVDTEIIQAESEHSAMSATIGASAAGVRSVTATSSQGLLHMAEMLPIASGLRLPIMMYVSSRAVSAPLNIHGEHGDVMLMRDGGWIQIFGENAQDAYDNGIIGMRLAEEVGFPVMAVMDGFHTSHTTERVQVCSDRDIKAFVGSYKPEQYLLDLKNPVTFGPLSLQNSCFEFRIDQQKDFAKAKSAYRKICTEFKKITGRIHGIYESYELADAEHVIVMMGATAGTAKDAIDEARRKGIKVGLLKIRLYRPFPYKEIGRVLAHAKNIAVLDRAMSVGAHPPLYQDVVQAVYGATSRKPDVSSYIYGLGGRDTMCKHFHEVIGDMEEGKMSDKVKYLR